MPILTYESPFPCDPRELFDWHARPGAFERLSPPWQVLRIEKPATIEDGSRAHLRMKKGPFSIRWVAEHSDVDSGRGFTDSQIKGPFKRWVHRHEFETHPGGALLRDRIDYQLPGGALGRALAGRSIRRDVASTFAYRHETTARELGRHQTFASEPRLRVAISGAGGLVGRNIASFLTTGGHSVVRLVRGGEEGREGTTPWRPESGLLSPRDLEGCDALIHLAGENIAAGRWTARRKQRIRASRVEGTRNLIRSLSGLENPPKTFVCASAIGYYGSAGDEKRTESSELGEGFLAAVCRDWERAADEAAELGMRVVKLRFGIILTPAGGALAKMLPPFRLGAGGRLGDGRQYMSWVSIDDAVAAAHHALYDGALSGPVNVVAPKAVTNLDFTKTLGRVLGRPTLFPMPAFAARAAFGEMADEMLLSSTRVVPQLLEKRGFRFSDRDLRATLRRLLGKVEAS